MRLGFVLKEAFAGLSKNASMVVSVVLVTFISLTFVGVAVLLQQQVGAMKAYWYDRAQVQVTFCSSADQTDGCDQTVASDDDIQAVQALLAAAPLADYIQDVKTLSSEQVLAETKQVLKDNPTVDLLTPDLVGAQIRITMKDPTNADIVVESLSGVAGVLSVEDERTYLEPIFNILNAASAAAIGIAVLMLIAAVLLISTTIRLSAFSRRREIGIMRLVGASNSVIEAPFVLEGVIAALVGSVLAGVALTAIVEFFVKGQLGSTLGGGGLLVGLHDVAAVAPILVVVGIVLAAASASVAIKRYLRV